MSVRLLLLAGTTEAREVAAALAGDAGVEVIASLAGATRAPQPLGVTTRIGGFGGRAAFEDYLRHTRIDAVLDATHPFAARISHRTQEVCARLGLAHAHLIRPGWTPVEGDRWVSLTAEAEAARHIPLGATVFLATGRQTLDQFAGLAGRTVYARQIDSAPDPFPFAAGDWIIGRPPFSVAQEIALFERLGVDWLVVKDAGGAASRSKIDAARALGLPVAMIRRPAPPPGRTFDGAEAALDWVRSLG